MKSFCLDDETNSYGNIEGDNMKQFIALFGILILASCSTFEIFFKDGPEAKKIEEPERILEIRRKWSEYRPKYSGATFITIPQIKKPYNSGLLSRDFLLDGLNATKFVRFLAGLSENITLSEELNDVAQHGAVLVAKTGFLTHTPARPSDMEIEFYNRGYAGTSSSNIHHLSGDRTSLSSAVMSFCDDSDESNIDRVGHRRWVLNPKLGKLGFGYAEIVKNGTTEAFVTMQVFDHSSEDNNTCRYVAFPSAGYFPNNFFDSLQAWSISLNPEFYSLGKCNPTVKLVRVSDSKEWSFSSRDKDKKGKYFNIDKAGFGFPYCIVFRPDGLLDILKSPEYRVTVSGLVDKSGVNTVLEYEVDFFTLF